MKTSLLLLCLLTSLLAHGQPLRKTVKSKSRYLLEQYEVLTTNDTLRVGSYRRYFRDGNRLLEEGQYDNNQRTGVWTFYDGKGSPELVYDYSAHKVITNNRTTLDSTGIIQQEAKNVVVLLNPPPLFLASTYQVTGILVREAKLPIHLQKAGVTQLSYLIIATVSPAGVHYKVVSSHTDTVFLANAKQAALLALKDVKWLPGWYQGKEVTTIYTLPAIILHSFSVVR
ncbi:toxin-antitoxin system YwqK family antitoxin [Spirosoma areae]